MNKQTVALIALFVGWILTAEIANATTYEDVAGQWCGDVTDYVFAPNSMLAKPARGARAMVPGDRVRPGEIAFTVMPSSPSSVARARVNPTIPPLLAA